MNFKDIIKNLQNLQKTDLEKIKNHIQFLLKDKNNSKKVENNEDDLFFTSIVDELYLKLKIEKTTLYFFKNTQYYKKFKECFAFVDDFVLNILKDETQTKMSKKVFYNLYAKLCIEFLIQFSLPVTIISIINCYEQFPGILDKHFPGYIQSGLGYLIIENKDNISKILERKKLK